MAGLGGMARYKIVWLTYRYWQVCCVSIGQMSVVAWIVLGFVAGSIAKALMPGRQSGGCIATIVLGIIGSVVGGALGSYFLNVDLNQGLYEFSTWASAIGGALVILAVWGIIRPK